MPIDPRLFKAPFIDAPQCWAAADTFRLQYSHSGTIPLDVLALAELDLGMEIRTVGCLKQDADVDALLLGDWKTLIVDKQQYLDDRFLHRLRFSVAHELGHFVLHKTVFKSIPRETPGMWIAFMQDMPDREYGFLEFQAYEFAGRLLVPVDALKAEFEKVLADAEDSGIKRHKLNDAHLSYLCIPLGKHFAVSQDVIEKRLNREKLWPL